jgi:hypothetical protein
VTKTSRFMASGMGVLSRLRLRAGVPDGAGGLQARADRIAHPSLAMARPRITLPRTGGGQ